MFMIKVLGFIGSFMVSLAFLHAGELDKAVSKGDFEKVKGLLDKGANPNGPKGAAFPPIFLAKNTKILELLVKKGANLKVPDGIGSNLITKASFYGRYEIVEYLLKNKWNPNKEDKRFYFPLLSAAEGSRNGIAKAGNHNEDIAELLIKNGADVNKANKYGTALHTAVKKGKAGFVELLLNNGAKKNIKDQFKKIPVDYLSYIKDEDTKNKIAKLLK